MQLLLLLLIELYTLFQLWLISVPKTINWKCIMSYLAVGTLGVTAITLTFHLVSARIIPPAINSYTINPFIEEMITILPVILLARFTVLKEKLGILDWMLLGAALGCGFQIMETGIRIIGLSQKWPHFQVGWTDVGDILTTWLPERIEDRNIGYAGHGIAAAFMGLGVGFWARYKRWGWIIFLASFLWCVIDHSLSNYTLGSWAGQKKLAKFFWGITLKGKSMTWVLGLAVVGISLHDIYQRSAFRSVAEKYRAIIAEITNRISKSVFWHHPISTLRKSFHDHIAEFRGKTGLGKTYEVIRIYFWFSIIVVFFLNGIFPKSFYRWYLKTPFWWSAGIIGHAFALWFAWKWFNKWRAGLVPRDIRSQTIFWGQGFISVVSPLLAAGSVAVVVLAIIGKPILLKTSYLYYAANAFLDFIRNGLSPALGVLNGIGGFVSNAYAQAATDPLSTHNIDERGFQFIAGHEGFSRTVYNDVAGNPTVGFGHMVRQNEAARFINGITREEALDLLNADVREAETAVNELVGVDINQKQFNAITSFVYNVGRNHFENSTLLRRLNSGSYESVGSELRRWNRAGGRVVEGLTNRRNAEIELFYSMPEQAD